MSKSTFKVTLQEKWLFGCLKLALRRGPAGSCGGIGTATICVMVIIVSGDLALTDF